MKTEANLTVLFECEYCGAEKEVTYGSWHMSRPLPEDMSASGKSSFKYRFEVGIPDNWKSGKDCGCREKCHFCFSLDTSKYVIGPFKVTICSECFRSDSLMGNLLRGYLHNV